MIRSGEHVLWDAQVRRLERRDDLDWMTAVFARALPHFRAATHAYLAGLAQA